MLPVWHKLIWEKAITKKRITILMKETKKAVIIIINTRTRNKILVRSTIFLLSGKTRTQNKRCAEFNNNLDFDDCSHEHPELSVPGN